MVRSVREEGDGNVHVGLYDCMVCRQLIRKKKHTLRSSLVNELIVISRNCNEAGDGFLIEVCEREGRFLQINLHAARILCHCLHQEQRCTC